MGKMNYFDKIEDYIEGNMTDVESNSFESELKNDEELKREYDAYLAAEIAVKALGYQLLNEKHKKPRSLVKLWLAVAASILLLVMTSVWYASSNYSIPVIVSKSRIQSEPNFTSFRGKVDSDPLYKAVNAFYLNDFNKVAEILSSIPSTDTAYISAQFILGHALLKNGDFDKAAKVFLPVLNDRSTLFTANAHWSEILALLSAGRGEEARSYLQEILNNPSDEYYEEALKLDTKLRSNWRKLVF